MKKLLILCSFVLLSSSLFASQIGIRNDIAITLGPSGYLVALPQATIQVCNFDISLICSSPILTTYADNAGNYSYSLASGKYLEKVSKSGVPYYTQTVTISAPQVNTDWNATSGVEQLINKPAFFTPALHVHSEADVTGLVHDLSTKAETSYVNSNLATKAPLASPTFTGVVTVPAPFGFATTQAANLGFVDNDIASNLAGFTAGGPIFKGDAITTPLATAGSGTDSSDFNPYLFAAFDSLDSLAGDSVQDAVAAHRDSFHITRGGGIEVRGVLGTAPDTLVGVYAPQEDTATWGGNLFDYKDFQGNSLWRLDSDGNLTMTGEGNTAGNGGNANIFYQNGVIALNSGTGMLQWGGTHGPTLSDDGGGNLVVEGVGIITPNISTDQFDVFAAQMRNLPTPTISSLSALSTGGTLHHSTSYCYVLWVEVSTNTTTSLPSPEVCLTTGAGADTYKITVHWNAVVGAEYYLVAGRTTGAEKSFAQTGSASYRGGSLYLDVCPASSGGNTCWVVDDGRIPFNNVSPPTVNTSGRISLGIHTPASSSEVCVQGQVWMDASYIYGCTATNTIKRAALSTF